MARRFSPTTLLRAFDSLLANHCVKTTTVATGVLMTTGDVVSQRLVEGRSEWDIARTAKFAGVGACFFGPAWTFWYRRLDVFIPRLVGRQQLQGLAKVFVDQSFFAPSSLLVFLFLLEVPDNGGNPVRFWEKTKSEFGEIMTNYYKVWPAVQLVNFYLIPPRHRVMLINFVALFWNTFLAWEANSGHGGLKEILEDVGEPGVAGQCSEPTPMMAAAAIEDKQGELKEACEEHAAMMAEMEDEDDELTYGEAMTSASQISGMINHLKKPGKGVSEKKLSQESSDSADGVFRQSSIGGADGDLPHLNASGSQEGGALFQESRETYKK